MPCIGGYIWGSCYKDAQPGIQEFGFIFDAQASVSGIPRRAAVNAPCIPGSSSSETINYVLNPTDIDRINSVGAGPYTWVGTATPYPVSTPHVILGGYGALFYYIPGGPYPPPVQPGSDGGGSGVVPVILSRIPAAPGSSPIGGGVSYPTDPSLPPIIFPTFELGPGSSSTAFVPNLGAALLPGAHAGTTVRERGNPIVTGCVSVLNPTLIKAALDGQASPIAFQIDRPSDMPDFLSIIPGLLLQSNQPANASYGIRVYAGLQGVQQVSGMGPQWVQGPNYSTTSPISLSWGNVVVPMVPWGGAPMQLTVEIWTNSSTFPTGSTFEMMVGGWNV